MNIVAKTDGKEATLLIVITAPRPVELKVMAQHPKKRNTFYTNRIVKAKQGTQNVFIRMPQSPQITFVSVYNKAHGNQKKGVDKSFDIVDFKILPLEKKLNLFDFRKKTIKDFVKFAQEFSENAGIISTGTYMSDDGKFRIDYLPYIVSDDTKKKMRTPLRISKDTGRIEIAKERYVNYTIPMRMMIMLHEFAHFYVNRDSSNEYEADYNALLIYLGLGYPRIEAFQAWHEVFFTSPSEGNQERWDKIEKFINEFEDNDYKIDYAA
jgi:hypothetical protein